jgi:hypothetical protein
VNAGRGRTAVSVTLNDAMPLPVLTLLIDRARRAFGVLTALACIAGAGVTLWLGAQSLLAGQTAQPLPAPVTGTVSPAPDSKTLQEETQKLRDQAEKLRNESVKLQTALDGERREAEAFRWLLTAIIGLGSLYGLFQGLYSYLNLQELKAQSQKAIDDVKTLRSDTKTDLDTFQDKVKTKAEDDFRKFRTECETQFPMFRGFETALGQMASQLKRRFASAALGDNAFRSLDDLGRQEIYYYEKSVASLQFVEVSNPEDRFHVLRGLSRFYSDKYRAEREDAAKPNHPLPSLNDLARAEYYLHRADLLPGDKTFCVLNERGYIALRAPAVPDWDRARTLFGQSKKIQSEQQCAHYNLARIAHSDAVGLLTASSAKAAALFKEAVDGLEFAAKQRNWEDTPQPAKASSIQYNLACGLGRLGGLTAVQQEKDDYLKRSFEALLKSIQQAPESRDNFEEDRKPGKDLGLLDGDARYHAKLEEFAAVIAKARSQAPNP